MCRIIGALGRYSKISEYYIDLVKGLIGASEYDPYSARAFGESDASHKDGWGRATVYVDINKTSLFIYKSLSPIFVDKPVDPLFRSEILRSSDPIVIDFIHARAASAGMPVNFLSVQPFEALTQSGSRLILIHNGSVDKDLLAKELRGKISESVIKRYSDTYLLTLYLAEKIRDEFDPSILKESKEFVKTALNLGVILISNSKIEKIFGSYYKKEVLAQEYWDYYRMYMAQLDESTIFYASSTIIDFQSYRPKKISDWREIPNNTFYLVEIELQGIKDIEIKIKQFNI